MEYFKYFPTIEYDSSQATNLMIRARIKDSVRNNVYVYYNYTIKDTDRPDIVASNYYGNSKYTWLIFYANDIFDPIFDWPMNEYNFRKYIQHKYGSDTTDGWAVADQTVNSYVNADGLIIDKTTYLSTGGTIVSELQHEIDLNEAKRNIKIIDIGYLPQIMAEFKNIMNQSKSEVLINRV